MTTKTFEPPAERAPRAPMLDEVFVLWSAARAEANLAYADWCEYPGADAYAVYRAAEDRADAAEAELAAVVAHGLNDNHRGAGGVAGGVMRA